MGHRCFFFYFTIISNRFLGDYFSDRVVATSRVSVDPAARSGASDVSYPTERDDGWMEVKLAEFSNDERMLTEAAVMVDFREVNDHVKKIGLIVEGLEFRPTIH
ncbi:hypothetical protein OsI_30357 [Oryza sativa Indica Group]|uniref:Uncharacterized protein n=1 Tax=Oryza sativa subsp. indica TaxID=39946 RepID=B8BD07_ORYSI|nr:hypothetical protein OsI_30357 [Oryza sativa Indica Group]